MATEVASLLVRVQSDTTSLTKGLNAAALAVGAFAGLSVKAAVDYDQAFTRIAAVSNASTKSIERWKEQVKDLAGQTARAPQELADALYFLASAGLKANQVMPVLRASAKAAASGLGDTADIARLTANVLNAYADSGIKAADVTDILVSAVKEGTAAPEEFADAMGRILPIASKAGVGFDQVSASLAALSNIGLDVNEGVTAMRGVLQALEAPGTQAAETLKKVGISAQEMRNVISEEGLLGALRLLEDRTNGNIDTMRKIVPNIRALTGVFGLTTQEAEKVDSIFRHVTHSTGDLDKAFETTRKGSAFKLQQALAKLRVVMIDVGEALLPIVIKVANFIGRIADAFTDLSPATQDLIIKITLLAAAFKLLGVGSLLAGLGRLVTGIAGVGAAAEGAEAAVGAGGLAGALGGLGALAAPIAVVTAGIVALKFAGDDTQERIDAMTESFRTGGVAAREFVDKTAAGLREVGAEGRRAGGFLPGAPGGPMDEANAALRQYADGLNKVARAAGLTGGEVGNFRNIMVRAKGTTEAQRHEIALLWNQYGAFGQRISDTTRRQLANLLAVGDVDAAIKLLRNDVREATRGTEEHARAVNRNAEAARKADQSQRQLAGAMRQTGNDANNAKGKVDGLGGAIKKLPKRKEVKVDVQDDATPKLASIQARLQELATDWTIRVHAAEVRGSPLPSELIAMLDKALKKLTRTDWTIEVKADGKQAEAALTAAQDQLDAFGKDIDKLSGKFDKLKGRIDTFRDAIRSGFAQFDLIGGAISLLDEFAQAMASLQEGEVAPNAPDLGAFVAAQAAQAQQLADVLTKLSAAGLNKDLLAQLAAQGPQGIALGQALLSNPALIAQFNQAQAEIAKALGQTTQQLISDQFGADIEKLQREFEHLGKRLQRFIDTLDQDLISGVRELSQRIRDILRDLGGVSGGGGTPGVPPGIKPPTDQPLEIHLYGDVATLVERIDQGLAGKARRNVKLAHHGR